jgi:nucleotide-binding universal stress UspA family protein
MKEASKTFQKIIVAYDDSPSAHDALGAGIELCKLLGTSLQTITVMEPPPAYTGFVVAVAPDVAQGIEADRKRHYEDLMESAVAEGRRHSVEVTGHLVEAEEVDGVISFLRESRADLLVIGLRQHSSHVARLWSTVSSLEEKAPCSVLAVHSQQGTTGKLTSTDPLNHI